jgi:Outer membrane protein beta-barrel domain
MHVKLIGSAVALLAMAFCAAGAQTMPTAPEQEWEDNPRGNVHLGAPIVIPLNPTARAVHLGFGLDVGGGYNFTRRHGLVGEFLWNNLLTTNEALAKLRAALGDSSLNANADVIAFTGNYRYELRGKRLGTYFLGGAGLFYRHTSVSKVVVTGNNIQCDPTWEWWGFTCTSGTVTENQTVGSLSTTGPGYNGGIGFTVRVGDPPYRFYAESRYFYAPNQRINTQLMEMTFGIRY